MLYDVTCQQGKHSYGIVDGYHHLYLKHDDLIYMAYFQTIDIAGGNDPWKSHTVDIHDLPKPISQYCL